MPCGSTRGSCDGVHEAPRQERGRRHPAAVAATAISGAGPVPVAAGAAATAVRGAMFAAACVSPRRPAAAHSVAARLDDPRVMLGEPSGGVLERFAPRNPAPALTKPAPRADRPERLVPRLLGLERIANQWQSVAISGNQWHSVALSGTQWHSVTTASSNQRGNQWQSPVERRGKRGRPSA